MSDVKIKIEVPRHFQEWLRESLERIERNMATQADLDNLANAFNAKMSELGASAEAMNVEMKDILAKLTDAVNAAGQPGADPAALVAAVTGGLDRMNAIIAANQAVIDSSNMAYPDPVEPPDEPPAEPSAPSEPSA